MSREPRAVCTDGLDVIRKEARLSRGSFQRKGDVFAYVGSIHNLKDLKEHRACYSSPLSVDSKELGEEEAEPLSSKYGTYKTVKAKFRP